MSSAQEQLLNLQKIGKLRTEPPNQAKWANGVSET